MEAMKADKVMKDEQLHMLYSVMESHLKMDVQAAFNEIEVKRAEERRLERERRLAEEATQRNKGVIDYTQEAGGSSSQTEIGGSSNQQDTEMAEVVEVQEQAIVEVVDVQEQEIVEGDEVMVEAEDIQEPDFMVVGEPSEPLDVENLLKKVTAIQRKRKAREVLLLEWKIDKFVLVGDAHPVPYNVEEVAREMKVKERRRKAKKTRGELVDGDSDLELFGEDEEENEDDDDEKDDKHDDSSDKDDKGDDDNDQGASGLLVRDPIAQERIEKLLNDETNEQEDDVQNEASSSGKQHADQVEVRRTRAEMLEELGLEEGKFKFDIEDEIPQSPAKDYEPRYAFEADHYDYVIVEDASDSSDDEIDFHYAGIVEKISTEGVPETVLREISVEERKKWFKNMPKERKNLRAFQYFTPDKNLSWGDILSWGYLEDLKFLSDIASLPWWDVDELVKTKNIKQFYYGLEVRLHDQDLWNYIKLQARNGYPDWMPQFPKQIVRIL
ncbi:hypothetical protein Hanom_Chr10g00914231 [Helianthus anomalus]